MPDSSDPARFDREYLALIFRAVDVCARYKPKFGRGQEGQSLDQFRAFYGADSFYSWFGLDSPLMYAAHKAAGGMTSVYRQIGKGCEWLFYKMLQDHLGLTPEQAAWSYSLDAPKEGKKKARVLSLDGRIPLDALAEAGEKKIRTVAFLNAACKQLGVSDIACRTLRGAVIEVRQGYKSMDSKRQNADIDNATRAYSENYLPIIAVLSEQIDAGLVKRYTGARCLVLRGQAIGSALSNTYAFTRDVVGYDLEGFFRRNTDALRKKTETVLRCLLET